MNHRKDKTIFNYLKILGVLAMLLVATFSARGAASATLAWDADSDSSVIGYRLYYGTASGDYAQVTDVGNLTTATVNNLAAGSTYFFVVTAYDSSNLESAPSNEASFTAPAPVVSLAGITDGESFNASSPITLTASSSGAGANITTVTFYQGSTQIGQTTGSSGSFAWKNAPTGTAVITAVGTDSAGNTVGSAQATITVVPFQVTGMKQLADGSFQLTIVGAIGRMNSVYVSTDLQQWTLLTTAMNTNGTLVVADPGAANTPKQFYKVVSN